jgi:hypothetical protein
VSAVIRNRLMCLYPHLQTLFGNIAGYTPAPTVLRAADSLFVSQHECCDLQRVLSMRVIALWDLLRHPSASTSMITFVIDEHMASIEYASAPHTIAEMHADCMEPGGRNTAHVYSCLDTQHEAARLAAEATAAAPILRAHNCPDMAVPSAASRLFAHARPGWKSVRYITDRFSECISPDSPVRQMAGQFLLGSYPGATPAHPTIRATVYRGCPIRMLVGSGLSSRELHEAIIEFCASINGPSEAAVPHAWWERARSRVWGSPIGPGRTKALQPRVCISVLGRLSRVAAPSRRWALSKNMQAVASAAMLAVGGPPNALWSTARAFGAHMGCEEELAAAMEHGKRLSSIGVVAASACIRRLALTVSPVTALVRHAQQLALRKAGRGEISPILVCTLCSSLCSTPKGGPLSAGVRINLTTGRSVCTRCLVDTGLVEMDHVGRIVRFCTPNMTLVSSVVCASCSVITVLRDEYVWGVMPMCADCYTQCRQTVCNIKVCMCGRPAAINTTEYAARCDRGWDVVAAMCTRHARLRPQDRQYISDLQLVAAK